MPLSNTPAPELIRLAEAVLLAMVNISLVNANLIIFGMPIQLLAILFVILLIN